MILALPCHRTGNVASATEFLGPVLYHQTEIYTAKNYGDPYHD